MDPRLKIVFCENSPPDNTKYKDTILASLRKKNILFDESDIDLIITFSNWQTMRTGRYRYVYAAHNKSVLYLARFVMGATANQVVDHINGNVLDNRKENLRICTHEDNMRNTRQTVDGYKGVSFKTRKQMWIAAIHVDYRYIHLGSFRTAQEAARAYNEGAIKYFGRFARLNEIKYGSAPKKSELFLLTHSAFLPP